MDVLPGGRVSRAAGRRSTETRLGEKRFQESFSRAFFDGPVSGCGEGKQGFEKDSWNLFRAISASA